MKAVRIFIKPDRLAWIDHPIQEGWGMDALVRTMVYDQFIVGAGYIIPADQIALMLLIETPDTPENAVFSFKKAN